MKYPKHGRIDVFSISDQIHADYYNHETLLSLFDTYVASIMNYYSEVYMGISNVTIYREKKTFVFFKSIPKVKMSIETNMIHCELRRLNMSIEE